MKHKDILHGRYCRSGVDQLGFHMVTLMDHFDTLLVIETLSKRTVMYLHYTENRHTLLSGRTHP